MSDVGTGSVDRRPWPKEHKPDPRDRRADSTPPLVDVPVVIVDRAGLNRECLQSQLVARNIDAAGAWDLESLLRLIHRGVPTIVLLNINVKDSDTLLLVCLDMSPSVRVIVFGLSEADESEVISCAETGANGLHLDSESFDHLLALIHSVNADRPACSSTVSAILLKRIYDLSKQQQEDLSLKDPVFTLREQQTLELLEAGLSNQQIATRLCLTLHTVKNHVHNVLTKLGVSTRMEAAALSRAKRYASLDPPQEETS